MCLPLLRDFPTLTYMSNRVALGEAIKAIRLAKQESHPEFQGSRFAITVGMSHAHLCNLEAGRKQPTPDVLARIALALNVPLNAISYTPSEGQAIAS